MITIIEIEPYLYLKNFLMMKMKQGWSLSKMVVVLYFGLVGDKCETFGKIIQNCIYSRFNFNAFCLYIFKNIFAKKFH